VRRIFEKYIGKDSEFRKMVSGSGGLAYEQGSELTGEIIFQRNRVQDKLVSIQNKNKRSEKELADELMRKLKENGILLQEINRLRDEKHN
jgi:hypothetical protein